MLTAGRHPFFVSCAPGVEPLLHAEMQALALSKVERQVGGCYFEGSLFDAMRANLWLRTAVRVLLRVARFGADDEATLYKGVQEVDWSRYVGADGTLSVDASSTMSKLDHTLFVAQRTKDAICDQFRESAGKRPSVDRSDADLGIFVHLVRDRCTVLIDTSGQSLHKRGWRRVQGRAPLSETLAAAVVLASGWDRRQPLVDPFCGSGTILVEAALIAANTAPGSFRKQFAFERWPGHEADAWQRLRDDAFAAQRPLPKLRLVGLDVDPKALGGARENAIAAGVSERIDLEQGDAREFDPRPGWNAAIVSNPPYGERIGRDVERLLASFGKVLASRASGSRLALLLPAGTATTLGLPNLSTTPLANGGIPCELAIGEIP